jgi:predicted dinucleotide-utilizing enzyme
MIRRFFEFAKPSRKGIYVPAGALWGAEDIKKMADRGTLKGLTVTMKKHPDSLKVLGPLQAKLDAYVPDAETVLFEGKKTRKLIRVTLYGTKLSIMTQ